MVAWAAIALALRTPDQDALYSRLSTYLHPLAGKNVAWHLLISVTMIRPKPDARILLTRDEVGASIIGDLEFKPVVPNDTGWWDSVITYLPEGVEKVLIVDAAAATLTNSLAQLVAGPTGRVLIGENNAPLALWLERPEDGEAMTSLPAEGLLPALGSSLDPISVVGEEGLLIRDRHTLARAGIIIRDRIVANLLASGVTFLLPETVLIDVDVRIESDTVIYPSVVLEGRTTIGAETVIGPGCRIIDSWIGSGVELKGWNYIVGANIRNRAVLEPYVRRGFD